MSLKMILGRSAQQMGPGRRVADGTTGVTSVKHPEVRQSNSGLGEMMRKYFHKPNMSEKATEAVDLIFFICLQVEESRAILILQDICALSLHCCCFYM